MDNLDDPALGQAGGTTSGGLPTDEEDGGLFAIENLWTFAGGLLLALVLFYLYKSVHILLLLLCCCCNQCRCGFTPLFLFAVAGIVAGQLRPGRSAGRRPRRSYADRIFGKPGTYHVPPS